MHFNESDELLLTASPWVQRWARLVTPQGTVLDVACGSGRHVQYFHDLGHAVTGLDALPKAVESAQRWGEILCADIENAAWPLIGRQFDAVVVTNYLHRPLFPILLQSLNEDGVFIYETFAAGNELLGRPSRPAFLLERGELLRVCATLRVVAYEDGFESDMLKGTAKIVQRIVAVREGQAKTDSSFPQRLQL